MMSLNDLSHALHVIGGVTAAESLKIALHLSRDQILINEDPISCGPAPATDDLNVWRSTRERFMRDVYPDRSCSSGGEYAGSELLANVERLGQEKAVVVWVARSLPEQLLFAWLVFLFDRLGLDLSKLRVVRFEKLRPRQRVLCMGELSPKNIREFCPEARHLKSEEVDDLQRAWGVYTSSDPSLLSRYVGAANPMSSLHQASSQLVYRYPHVRSGIGIWDEKLLHYTKEKGPLAVRAIGYTMAFFSETLDLVDDLWLFWRLIGLGSADLTSPLISISGDTRNMRKCEVKLTLFGQKVLAGEANCAQENGIDDWVGGVHLNAKEPITFRKGDSLVLPA